MTSLDWSHLSRLLLARDDVSTRLSDSFHRCFTGVTRELVLITGPPGVGKTSIAYSLQSKVDEANGFMVSGKFEQLDNNLVVATTKAYGAICEAFAKYIELVINSEDYTEAQRVKESLEAGMDSSELRVIQEVIPDLDRIVGRHQQTTVPSQGETSVLLKGVDAEDRLIQIFSRFVRTICSLGRPIILFLDDVQWAKSSAINLLAQILDSTTSDDAGSTNPPLMLICTCRMEEVSMDHPLAAMLRDLNDKNTVVTELALADLQEEEVNQVVAEVLHSSVSDVKPLSNILFQQTAGNLLYLIELIKYLCEDNVITNKAGRWIWNIEEVRVAGSHGSFSQLVEKKFRRLKGRDQELLRIASCLGSAFSVTALSYAGVVVKDEIDDSIRSLERTGLICVDGKTGICRFVHDKVQQSVYHLTPDTAIEELHLKIGRELRKSMPKQLLAENILLVSHQISLGVRLIESSNERNEVAELFFQAGQQAALSSSFKTAAAYLNLAINLLSRRHWRDHYKTSLRLYNFAAEIEYYNGHLERFDELVNAVLIHARCFDDTLVARFTRIYSLGSRGNMQEGLTESLHVLQTLGEKFPRKPSIFNVLIGWVRCKHVLYGKTDDQIFNLPTLHDKRQEAAMRLMIYSMLFAFYSPGFHLPLIAFRMVENTMTYGMSGMACVGFGCLAMVAAFRGNIEEAYRFSRLSLRLFDEYGAKEWQARVYGVAHGMIFPLKHPFRETVDPLYTAHRSSLVLGDIHFSMLCCALYANRCYWAGFPLARVMKEAKRCKLLCIKYGQSSAQSLVELYLQLVLNLMGKSTDSLVLTGEVTNEDIALRVAKRENPVDYLHLHLAKLQLAVYMNDLSTAQACLSRLKSLDKKKFLPYMIALLHFYEGIAYAMSPVTGDANRARKRLKKLKLVAKHSPCNFRNKAYMIEGELANRAGMIDVAMANFNLSIDLSRKEGLIHDNALACERAAYALERHGRQLEANRYFADARSLYSDWGAQAKVDTLSLS